MDFKSRLLERHLVSTLRTQACERAVRDAMATIFDRSFAQ